MGNASHEKQIAARGSAVSTEGRQAGRQAGRGAQWGAEYLNEFSHPREDDDADDADADDDDDDDGERRIEILQKREE